MRHVSRALARDNAQEDQPDQRRRPGAHPEWYLSGKQGLRDGQRILEELKQDFLHLGRIDAKWNVVLDETFGHQLRQLLTQWAPANWQAALVADMLTKKAKTFNKPLPSIPEDKNSPKVIVDPLQSAQMVINLLELEGNMLADLWKSSEHRASETAARGQNDAVDFAPRYFSTACRDLHRAIDRYMELKKNNL